MGIKGKLESNGLLFFLKHSLHIIFMKEARQCSLRLDAASVFADGGC
jgi:hypothetical protein